jgi:hypothetical protein
VNGIAVDDACEPGFRAWRLDRGESAVQGIGSGKRPVDGVLRPAVEESCVSRIWPGPGMRRVCRAVTVACNDQGVPEHLRRDHVVRDAPPWRTGQFTECGHPIDGLGAIIDGQELTDRITTFGQARTEFTVCPVCWATARCAPRWDVDPVAVLAREAQTGHTDGQLRTELIAIAALINAHPQEFSGAVRAIAATADISDRRRRR